VRRAMAGAIKDMERNEEETQREKGGDDHARNVG
jgi:hypothetical protein